MSARKLRVLHCIPTLGGGGAERQLSHIAGGLTKTDVDVHVAYLQPGPNLDSMRDSGVTMHPLRSHYNFDPSILWQLLRTIHQVRPDLVQTWLTQMDILGGLAAVVMGTPFILCERASAPAYGGGWKDKLRGRLGRRATMVVANSEAGEKYWIARKEPKLIKVIPNGVPLELIKHSAGAPCEEFGIGPSTEVMLFAGRYAPEKNVLNLLAALRRVLAEKPQAIALLFGQGQLQTDILEIIKRCGIEDRVKVSGYTTQLWSWMRRANVLVSVSLFEGSPNVVCEAAAVECPLVVSDIPAHRELLNSESAVFVSPSSPTDIARGILDVLSNPTAARRRAATAYEQVRRFSVEGITREYIELYRAVLSRPSLAISEGIRSEAKES
jgi:glycosyltransferase involved in cell wall biosynthesis